MLNPRTRQVSPTDLEDSRNSHVDGLLAGVVGLQPQCVAATNLPMESKKQQADRNDGAGPAQCHQRSLEG